MYMNILLNYKYYFPFISACSQGTYNDAKGLNCTGMLSVIFSFFVGTLRSAMIYSNVISKSNLSFNIYSNDQLIN